MQSYQRPDGLRDISRRIQADRYQTQHLSVAAPVTGAICKPTVAEACHRLFLETAGFCLAYYDRMPADVARQLNALYRAYQGYTEQTETLEEALRFFVHSDASRESEAVRQALMSAKLALMRFDTSGYLVAVSPEPTSWLL